MDDPAKNTFQTFSTPDLCLAAFLFVKGCTLVDVEDEGQRLLFCFTGNGRELTEEYYRDGMVPVLSFKEALYSFRLRVRKHTAALGKRHSPTR